MEKTISKVQFDHVVVGASLLDQFIYVRKFKSGIISEFCEGLKVHYHSGIKGIGLGTAKRAMVFLGLILFYLSIPALQIYLINGRFFLGVYLLIHTCLGKKIFAPFMIMLLTTWSLLVTLGKEPTYIGERLRIFIRPSLLGRKSKYISILFFCADGETTTTGPTPPTTEDSVGVGVVVSLSLFRSH